MTTSAVARERLYEDALMAIAAGLITLYEREMEAPHPDPASCTIARRRLLDALEASAWLAAEARLDGHALDHLVDEHRDLLALGVPLEDAPPVRWPPPLPRLTVPDPFGPGLAAKGAARHRDAPRRRTRKGGDR